MAQVFPLQRFIGSLVLQQLGPVGVIVMLPKLHEHGVNSWFQARLASKEGKARRIRPQNLGGPLNQLNAFLSLLQPLDRYRTPSAIGSAIGGGPISPYLASTHRWEFSTASF